MMQPLTTRGAVEKPNSSAPSNAAITTSRPVFNWPSVCTTIRSRSLFCTSTCCVSARPSSQGQSGMFQGTDGGGAGAAVIARDQDHVRMGLGYPRGNRTHAYFRHQFHMHARFRVGILEIVDQLGQILNRIYIMVRRRRDQAHPGGGMSHPLRSTGRPWVPAIALLRPVSLPAPS